MRGPARVSEWDAWRFFKKGPFFLIYNRKVAQQTHDLHPGVETMVLKPVDKRTVSPQKGADDTQRAGAGP